MAEAAANGEGEENAQRREEKIKLEKAGKGLLNRLGESNIEGILGEVEGLYRKFPRNGTFSSWDLFTPKKREADIDPVAYLDLLRCHYHHDYSGLADNLIPRQPPRFICRPLRYSRSRPLQDHGSGFRLVSPFALISQRPKLTMNTNCQAQTSFKPSSLSLWPSLRTLPHHLQARKTTDHQRARKP